MPHLPQVAWTTIIDNVVMVDGATYDVTVVPVDPNEPGAQFSEKEVGYYLKDNVGHTYSISDINIGGNPDRIRVVDDFGENIGPQSGQFAFIYKSVGNGSAPYLAPIRHERLDESALDYSRAIELDVLWTSMFRLNQDPPQTVIGGAPIFSEGIESKYVDLQSIIDPPHKEGRIYYDPASHSLTVKNDIVGVSHNLGREHFKRVRRASSSSTKIYNGQVVYISGVESGGPKVELARADRYNTSRIIGVATTDIEIGGEGDITLIGDVNDIDLSGFVSSGVAYLSATIPGGLTQVKPTGGNFPIVVGIAQEVGLHGSLFVSPQLSEHTDELVKPRGFTNYVDGIDTTLTYNNATRTLTISPVGSSFYYYFHGEKYIKTAPESIVTPDVEGMHFVYYDEDTLTLTSSPTYDTIINIVRDKVLVSVIYWDATNNTSIYVGNERHTFNWPSWLHQYIHDTRGTQYIGGLGLSGFTFGNGQLNSHAQFGVDSGTIADEDILTSTPVIPATQGMPIYYRLGNPGVWRRIVRAGYSFTNDAATGLVNYNRNLAGTWSIANMTNNYYRAIHVFATNDLGINKNIVFSGTDQYATLELAEDGVRNEVMSIYSSSLPMAELKHIGTVFIQTKDSFSNSVRAAIVKTVKGYDYLDFRRESPSSVGTSSPGAQSYLDLNDTDDSYTGHQGKVPMVNAVETGLTFGHISNLHQPDGTNPFVYTDNSGALHIDGDIIQNGSSYETHAEQLYTKNDLIILRDGAVVGLGVGEYAGFQAKLYDGINDGQLVFDKDGIARVGDVGGLQPLTTRIESPTNGYFAYWEGANFRLNFKQFTTSDISDLTSYTGFDSRYYTETEICNFFSGNTSITGYNKDSWDGKQDFLVSGTNIKTINGYSILGSGNIEIQGGGSSLTRVKDFFIATAGQTVFTTSVPYSVGSVDVYYNGSHLSKNEFVATNGTSVVLATPAIAGHEVEVVSGEEAGAAPISIDDFIMRFDSGVTEGVDMYTFDGSINTEVNLIAGTNISLIKSANTISINNNYSHPLSTAYASGLYKITTNSLGHVSLASLVQKSDITSLGIPEQDTTYNVFNDTTSGLVPSPNESGDSKFLSQDGTWQVAIKVESDPTVPNHVKAISLSDISNWNSSYTFASGFNTAYPDLVAIESLSGTSGLLRKTAVNTWILDTTQYGSSAPNWHGNIYGAFGSCDPQDLLNHAITSGTVAPTPTNITASLARIAYFRPPANITVNKIRFYGVGATSGIYQVAIYNADTLARLTSQLPITTSAAKWGSVGSSLGITLSAGQLYFIAVSANAVGTTAGILSMGATQAATTGTIAVLPKNFPGNLDIDLGYISGAFAQFAVTTGALPATAGTIVAQTAWTGGFPAFFLDNNNT